VLDLDVLTENIASVVNELNKATLSGFIHSVCTQENAKLATED
jgi:hypothetical protein